MTGCAASSSAEGVAVPLAKKLETLDLQIYSANWCPDCRRLDRWLAEAGLEIPKVDIEAEPGAAERLEAETGRRGIPYFLVNGNAWVRGYHKERPGGFDPAVLVQELLETAAR
jgi:glutaredoxin